MHKQPVFNKMGWYSNESHPISEFISDKGFYIPSGLGLYDSDMDQVVSAMKKVFT
ncbi:MAG: hypothetical protein OHK0056_33100 [Bacteriovoracaceae bacterium]